MNKELKFYLQVSVVVQIAILLFLILNAMGPPFRPPELDDFVRYVDEEFGAECYVIPRYEEMSCLWLEE